MTNHIERGRFAALHALAARQDGLIAMWQSVEVGLPRRTMYRHLDACGWRKVQVGVHAAPWAVSGWRHHARAAVLAAREPAAVTGAAALRLHGLDEVPEHLPVQLVVPGNRSAPQLRPPAVAHRCTTLGPGDVVRLAGMPVTSPAWALAQLGRVASEQVVLDLSMAAEQCGLVDGPTLEATRRRAGPALGVARLRRARQRLGDDLVDSPLELRVRRLLRSNGLSPHPTPFPFACPDGVVIHLDIAFPGAWIAIEVDGRAAHGPEAFDGDRLRWEQADQGGWTVRWATSKRLVQDPLGFVTDIRRLVHEADRWKHPATPTACGRSACRVCRDAPRHRGQAAS